MHLLKSKNTKASHNFKKGFTLIELLVVIAIIGVLSSIVLASLNNARKTANDAKRLSDIHQIQTALEMYRLAYNAYPGNTDNDCSGWDTGFNGGQDSGDPFISQLSSIELNAPGDPNSTSSCGGYKYYKYGAGSSGCDTTKGAFYVIEVNMESSGNPYPTSPGWSCPLRNWQTEADWVTGSFEN
jgi:prepilin-type N-terminal cleavage/methylation domain-containing protein